MVARKARCTRRGAMLKDVRCPRARCTFVVRVATDSSGRAVFLGCCGEDGVSGNRDGRTKAVAGLGVGRLQVGGLPPDRILSAVEDVGRPAKSALLSLWSANGPLPALSSPNPLRRRACCPTGPGAARSYRQYRCCSPSDTPLVATPCDRAGTRTLRRPSQRRCQPDRH